MSRIKSTVDLIMEKTRGMDLTSEEKDEARKEKIKREVRGVVMPYLRGEISLDRFRRNLSRDALGAAVDILIESLSIVDDNSRALEALESMRGSRPEAATLLEEARVILKEYEASRTQERARLKDELLKELARWGISGSAVQPPLDADLRWRDRQKALEEAYGARLRNAATRLITAWEKTWNESSRSSGE